MKQETKHLKIENHPENPPYHCAKCGSKFIWNKEKQAFQCPNYDQCGTFVLL